MSNIITPGAWVKFQHSSGPRIFRGQVLKYLGTDKFYAWVRDSTGLKPRIVRAERLKPAQPWFNWDEVA